MSTGGRIRRRIVGIVGVASAVVILAAGFAAAQTAGGPPVAPPPRGGAAVMPGDLSGPAEVQRLFDAYILIRAQEALKLDDEQFGVLLPKLQALQATRRRNEQAHNQMMGELNRLTVPNAAFDESIVRDKLKTLQEQNLKGAMDLKKAYDAVDQVLDVRRQARFRVFEMQMERRKLDLVLQARRGEAGRPVPLDGPPIKK